MNHYMIVCFSFERVDPERNRLIYWKLFFPTFTYERRRPLFWI